MIEGMFCAFANIVADVIAKTTASVLLPNFIFSRLKPFSAILQSQNAIIPWVSARSGRGYAGSVPKSISGKPLIARLRELRKRHSLTQEKFSELSGVAYKYYQLIEGGHRVDLRLSTLEKLAKAYGIGVHELLAPNFPKIRVTKSAAKKPLANKRKQIVRG